MDLSRTRNHLNKDFKCQTYSCKSYKGNIKENKQGFSFSMIIKYLCSHNKQDNKKSKVNALDSQNNNFNK